MENAPMGNDNYDPRREWLVDAAERGPEEYPSVYTISPAMMYDVTLVPKTLGGVPEYVWIPIAPHKGIGRLEAAISEWNMLWEAGPLRRTMVHRDFPESLRRIIDATDRDVRLIPRRERTRYAGTAPLYHLLPWSMLRRHGLPALRRHVWPTLMEFPGVAKVLPTDFDDRFSACFAQYIWPLLSPGSSLGAFSSVEPLRLLAHNLDFWLPFVDLAAQERVRSWGRTTVKDDRIRRKIEEVRSHPRPPDYPDFTVERPLYGGYVWSGEEEAWDVTRRVVELADCRGKLRGIVDAVRSHRVEDDFSSKWSHAKEDFERKLYRKRSKVRVSFVELDERIPVYGPDSEVEFDRRIFWEDFLALLDAKERHVIVLLRSGHTQSEIASALGYESHSPVSKALSRICRKAERLLDS